MKKRFNVKSLCAILLCFVMIISLCACTDTEQNASTNDDASAPAVNSSVDADNSDDETPSQDATSSNESDGTTTQTPSQNTEGSKVESTVTSSTPVTSTTPSISEPTPTTSSTPAPTQKTAKELIVGKWQGSLDMAPMFSEEMGFEFKGPATVWCDMEFTSGGVVYEIINRVSLTEAYFNVYSEWLNNSLTEEGLTKEQFETGAGMSFDEYINTLVEASMKIVPLTATHSYKFEGNDLYILQQGESNFEKTEYSFDGDDKLILNQDGVNVTYTRNK